MQNTKKKLAERVAYRCSNPTCDRTTVGPHSLPNKSTLSGEAAHIKGAKPGAARYDGTQTDEQRRDIPNGIWLCKVCHSKADQDEQNITVEMLINWKKKAEHLAKLRLENPELVTMLQNDHQLVSSEIKQIRQLLNDLLSTLSLNASAHRAHTGEIPRSACIGSKDFKQIFQFVGYFESGNSIAIEPYGGEIGKIIGNLEFLIYTIGEIKAHLDELLIYRSIHQTITSKIMQLRHALIFKDIQLLQKVLAANSIRNHCNFSATLAHRFDCLECDISELEMFLNSEEVYQLR